MVLFLSIFRVNCGISLLVFLCVLLLQSLDFCWSINDEGLALLRFREGVERDPSGALSNWNVYDDDPCLWFGVGCSEGKVVTLNLNDLSLIGTLAPDLGKLIHIKSINLHNNSFCGIIPKEFGELKRLEVLDLGHNNFSGPFPHELDKILALNILLLSNNMFLSSISPKHHEVNMHSVLKVDKNMLSDAAQGASSNRISISRNIVHADDSASRRLLQAGTTVSPSEVQKSNKMQQETHVASSPLLPPTPSQPPSTSVSPSPASTIPTPTPFMAPTQNPPFPAPAPSPIMAPFAEPPSPIMVAMPPSFSSLIPSPSGSPVQLGVPTSQSGHTFSQKIYLPVIIGASLILLVLVIFYRNNRSVSVRPWTIGLSGQLQKAFVTGVPRLRQSELETACEDFSNIIDSSSDSTVYKGTLSSGVEIAVTSSAVTSAKSWSKHSEAQFRKKIDTLSKVNHKNFVNLIGYCEEEEPFTRMMVFEYAPNGTLFEHLHVNEVEHLDWRTRLRIAMGMAYCLDHMHQLNPPIVHKFLHSTSVYLTEDYAAKIADFGFWNEEAVLKPVTDDIEHRDTGRDVYNFGIILLEMISGKYPYSEDKSLLVNWASGYLRGEKSLEYIMDPTLKSFREEEVRSLCEVIWSCIDPDLEQRPAMRDITARLREITEMPPEGATPKQSPLWWAELEILSSVAA